MSTLNRRKQRVLVVEKDFQFRFTLKILLTNGLILLVFGGAILFVVRLNYEMLIRDALIQMPDMVSNLRHELRVLSLVVSLGLVLMLSLIFLTGLFLTQKIAGPLYAFKRRLKEFGSGNAGVRLKLRTGDELQSLEALFNESMEFYDEQLRFTRKELEELQVLVESKFGQEKIQTLLQRLPTPKVFHH